MLPTPAPARKASVQRKSLRFASVSKYQKRISRPLMDRIDIHLDVRRVPYQKLSSLDSGETSVAIRTRVEAARQVQQARFAALGKPSVLVNGDMGPAEVQTFCKLDDAGKNLMRPAVAQMDLSARANHRVLKPARTVADLAGEESIQAGHLAEELQYRPSMGCISIVEHFVKICLPTGLKLDSRYAKDSRHQRLPIVVFR
jgi:predicted ATPase with chaperone activity